MLRSFSNYMSPNMADKQAMEQSVINSNIVGVSLVGDTTPHELFQVHLTAPIQLVLRHLEQENVSNARCVFWDHQIR